MIEFLNYIIYCIEYAGQLIARPITLIAFLFFTIQSVKVFHYMSDKPFPARIGFGGLVLFSFSEIFVRCFLPRLEDLTDMFFVISLVISRMSLTAMFDLTVIEVKDFYTKLRHRMEWTKLIIGIFAGCIFVYYYADKQLLVEKHTQELTQKDIESKKQLAKSEQEKNKLLKENIEVSNTVVSSVSTLSDKVDKNAKVASKERGIIIKGQSNKRQVKKPINKNVEKVQIKLPTSIKEGNEKRKEEKPSWLDKLLHIKISYKENKKDDLW